MRRISLHYGFTLLEFEVAMVIFGIALCGVLPLATIYAHIFALRELEQGYPEQSVMWFLDRNVVGHTNQWYLIPAYYVKDGSKYMDVWAQKLGTAAYLSPEPPTPLPQNLDNPAFNAICDDDDENYSEVGEGWADETAGYNGSSRAHEAVGEGEETDYYAEWTFTDLPLGWYQFQATWPDAIGQAEDAQYEIFDDDVSKGSVLVQEIRGHSSVTYGGVTWQILGTYHIESGTAKVRLYCSSTETVVADAVRIVPLKVLSCERKGGTVTAEFRIGDESSP